MKSRFNIYTSMERAFLSVQSKIRKLKQGSVVRALLFSVSDELSRVYQDVDTFKRNIFIDTASGEYLDSLIQGFVNLPRRRSTFASGYVVIELGEEITPDNINLLSFAFANYDKSTNSVNSKYQGVQSISVDKGTRAYTYHICQPQNFDVTENAFERNPVLQEQRLFATYKNYLIDIYNATGKGVKTLVLPIVSSEPGRNQNLESEEMDSILNIGLPATIRNLYYVPVDEQHSTADVDGVLSLPQGTSPNATANSLGYRVLGDYSYVTGADNEESDASYRDRFYLYINSLSRGTLDSLEFAVKTFIPNVRVKAIESGTPGIVTVYVDSPQIISRNLLSKVNDIIRDYRSAGILVNLRPTKVERITVLADFDGDSLESATERARTTINNSLENKELAETITYTELHELLDLTEIKKTDNLYYGLYLTAELFNLFKTTLTEEVFGYMSTEFRDKFSSDYSQVTYPDLLDAVNNGEINLFDVQRTDINYPLIQLVRKTKEMNLSQISDSRTQLIVSTIQNVCGSERKAGLCAEKMRNDPSVPNEFTITIKDLEKIVGRWYSNYFKIKMMTIPPVRHLKSLEAAEVIKDFARNDVINLSYDDLIEIDIGEFSKTRLARNLELNNKLYKNSSLVAGRKIER